MKKITYLLLSMIIVLNASDIKTTEMIKIPAGSFIMGSDKGEKNEKPAHKVVINYNFFMDKYEVTIRQYKRCVDDKICQPPLDNKYYEKMCQKSNCPVVNVSWNDAKTYATWLKVKTGKKYRLPTEAEWEYAARAGSITEYSYGDDKKDLHRYAWYGKINGATTKPIGMKKPNPWGLYDMHGGVWEWCEDSYFSSYKDTNYIHSDGSAAKGMPTKVLKGGSWYCPDKYLRSAYRLNNGPNSHNTKAGFRLVRDN